MLASCVHMSCGRFRSTLPAVYFILIACVHIHECSLAAWLIAMILDSAGLDCKLLKGRDCIFQYLVLGNNTGVHKPFVTYHLLWSLLLSGEVHTAINASLYLRKLKLWRDEGLAHGHSTIAELGFEPRGSWKRATTFIYLSIHLLVNLVDVLCLMLTLIRHYSPFWKKKKQK